jgi:hypothetical protein
MKYLALILTLAFLGMSFSGYAAEGEKDTKVCETNDEGRKPLDKKKVENDEKPKVDGTKKN